MLVLRDVLGYRAEEVAEMLETTAASVNSLLRRARAAFESRLPAAGRERAPLPNSKLERDIVGRFADAIQNGDIDGVVALLTDDAWLTMPPEPYEYQGPPRSARSYATADHAAARRCSCRPAPTPSQHSAATSRPETDIARPYALLVLTLEGDRISAITWFGDSSVFRTSDCRGYCDRKGSAARVWRGRRGQCGRAAPASATTTPTAPAASSVGTTPRRSTSSATAAAASTANCQASCSAPASVIAAPRIAPIAAGPAPSRNARARGVLAQPLEAPAAEQDERERRGERDERGEQAAGEAVRGVADGGDGGDDRAGRDLAERDGVEELGVGHPVVGVHGVALHQRDDHEAAAERQRADLERGPGQRAEPADGDRAPAASSRERARTRRRPRPALHEHSTSAAGEQHEHEVGADQRRGGGADGEVGDPASRCARGASAHAREARPDQPARGVDRHRRDRRAGAGARRRGPTAAARARGTAATARGSGRPPGR